MFTIDTDRLECVLNSAASVVSALQHMRDTVSEADWDALNEAGALTLLLDACSDLEADMKTVE